MLEKLLTYKILANATAYPWEIQGLGMLRLNLTAMCRLHVWDSRYKIAKVSPIHTHPWKFSSRIIAGRVDNRRFVETGPMPLQGAVDYHSAKILCGATPGPSEFQETRLFRTMLERYHEGESYGQLANEIHESQPLDGTVTIITRHFSDSRDNHARVFWKTGDFVSAAPRPATDEEVRDITQQALQLWFQEYHRAA